MKKGSIVSLVFSCLFFVLGVSLVVASFRQALTPVSIQHYAEGFTMRLSINNLNLAISSISLMFLLLGSTLFISGILLLMYSSYLHISALKLEQNNNKIAEDKPKAEMKVIEEKPKKKKVKKQESPKQEIIEETEELVEDDEVEKEEK